MLGLLRTLTVALCCASALGASMTQGDSLKSSFIPVPRYLEGDECANSTLTEDPCCTAGQGWSLDDGACETCLAGSFGDGYVCAECAAGEYSVDDGASECFSCGAHGVESTDDMTSCECTTATDVLVGPNEDDTYDCFAWECELAMASSSGPIVDTEFDFELDVSACAPEYGSVDYTWSWLQVGAVVADDDDSASVGTTDPTVAITFTELGDWVVTVTACSSAGADENWCTDAEFNVTVISPCESWQGVVEGVCADCDAGFQGDGVECVQCGESFYGFGGQDACEECGVDQTPTESQDGCACDDATTVAVWNDETGVFDCFTPTFDVTIETAELDGSVGVAIPFSDVAEVTVEIDLDDAVSVLSLVESWTIIDETAAEDCGDACTISETEDGTVEIEITAFGEYSLSYEIASETYDMDAQASIMLNINDDPVLSAAADSTSATTEFVITTQCSDAFANTCAEESGYTWTFTPAVTSNVMDGETIDTACADDDDGPCTYTIEWTVTSAGSVDDASAISWSVVIADEMGATDSATGVTTVDATSFTPLFTDTYGPALSDWTADDMELTFDIGTSDPDDAGAVTCTLSNPSGGASVTDQATGSCDDITMSFPAAGEYTVDVALEDAAGETSSTTMDIMIWEDSLMSDKTITRPSDSVSWLLAISEGASIDTTTVLDGATLAESEDATLETNEGTTGVTLTVTTTGFVGDLVASVGIDYVTHYRTATAVLTSDPAVPTATLSGDFVAATDENPAYLLVASFPASIDFTAAGSVPEGEGSVDWVHAEFATFSGVFVGSAEADADTVDLTVSVDAPDEFVLSADVLSNYDVAADTEETFYVLSEIALSTDLSFTMPQSGDLVAQLEVTIIDPVYTEYTFAWTAESEIFVTDEGNSDTSTAEAPFATFSAAGTVDFTLTVTAVIENFAEPSPVSTEETITVTLLEAETSDTVAAAARASDEQLTDQTTSFTLTAAGSESSIVDESEWGLVYAWTTEDASIFSFDDASAEEPVVTVTGDVAVDTTYTFSVQVTDSFTGDSSASVDVSFDFYPTISVAVSPDDDAFFTTEDGSFEVVATAEDPEGGALSYAFMVTGPDGRTTTTEQDAASFDAAATEGGVYTVWASTTDEQALTTTTATQEVEVYSAPEVSFLSTDKYASLPDQDGTASTISVTAQFEDAIDSSLTWTWAVDSDDATVTGDGVTASVESATVGTYVVTATGENAAGMTGSASINVHILESTNTIVTIVFQEPTVVVVGESSSVVIDASESASSSGDPDAAQLTYVWSLTPGYEQPEGATPAITTDDSATATASGLTVEGEYSFSLTAIDGNNKNATDSVVVQVTEAPSATVSASRFYTQDETLPETVSFSTSSVSADVASYEWSLADDCTGVAADASTLDESTLVLESLERGLCEITLTLTDDLGAQTSYTRYYQAVEVTITSPTAFSSWYQGQTYEIEWTSTGFGGDNVELFMYLVYGSSGDEDWKSTSYNVQGGSDFSGDGTFSFTVPTDYSGENFNSNNGDKFVVYMSVIDLGNAQGNDETTSAEFSIKPATEWSTSLWSSCAAVSGTCGTGARTRTVSCVSASTGAAANAALCRKYVGIATPASSEACDAGACAANYWYTSDYGSCTTTQTDYAGACGAGTKTRTVTCKIGETGADAADSQCTDTKPSTSKYCSAGKCEAWEWQVKSVSECSAECGGGTTKTRYGCKNTVTGFWADDKICARQSTDSTAAIVDPKPATVSTACNTDACPTYRWKYGAYSACSETCGTSGTKTRTATCQEDGVDIEDESLCGTVGKLSKSCNRFACTYYWYDVGSWSTTCDITDGSDCGAGTTSRDVYCISSADPETYSTDLSACEDANLAFQAATTRSCETACSFCSTTDCSGSTSGSCKTSIDACVCNDGFSGDYCEVADECVFGTLDGTGECCETAVDPATNLCCVSDSDDSPAVLDKDGACCASGTLTECGECCTGTDCDVVKDINGECCADDLIDAASVCCDDSDGAEVDFCGVCGGENECNTALALSAAIAGSLTCDDYNGNQTLYDEYVTGRQAEIASILGLSTSQIQFVDLVCEDTAADRRILRRLLDVSVDLSYLVLADETVTADSAADLLSESSEFDTVETEPTGACGNAICEVNEQCLSDGSNSLTCCLEDCPLVAAECDVPENGDGEECGGHGVCVYSAGSCSCYEGKGYTGDACDECLPGFYSSGTGEDFECVSQVETVTYEDDDFDFSIDQDDALRVLAVLLPMAALAGVVFMIYAKKNGFCGIKPVRRNQPLFNEQTVKSAELTSI